jgi:hypothetical protein
VNSTDALQSVEQVAGHLLNLEVKEIREALSEIDLSGDG